MNKNENGNIKFSKYGRHCRIGTEHKCMQYGRCAKQEKETIQLLNNKSIRVLDENEVYLVYWKYIRLNRIKMQ